MKGLNTSVKNVGERFQKFFNKKAVNASACVSGFTRRLAKKIDGYAFLVAMTLGRLKKSGQFSLLYYPISGLGCLSLWFTPTV